MTGQHHYVGAVVQRCHLPPRNVPQQHHFALQAQVLNQVLQIVALWPITRDEALDLDARIPQKRATPHQECVVFHRMQPSHGEQESAPSCRHRWGTVLIISGTSIPRRVTTIF